MTRLLVSVRNSGEAAVALRAGADLIDVKEPSRGSLGPADFRVVEQVLREVAGRVSVSAALGELRDWPPDRGLEVPAGLAFAKLGLSGCAAWREWPTTWAEAAADFPPEVGVVGVVYADWSRAASPSPDQVLAEAARTGCRAVLVDTYDKSAGGLLECWPAHELADFVDSVRQAGMLIVLAGSLCAKSISAVLSMEPDYVAVRGAVCRGGRTGAVDGVRVTELAGLVRRRNSYRFSSIA